MIKWASDGNEPSCLERRNVLLMGLWFIRSLRLRARSPRDLPALGSGGAELTVPLEWFGSGEAPCRCPPVREFNGHFSCFGIVQLPPALIR